MARHGSKVGSLLHVPAVPIKPEVGLDHTGSGLDFLQALSLWTVFATIGHDVRVGCTPVFRPTAKSEKTGEREGEREREGNPAAHSPRLEE